MKQALIAAIATTALTCSAIEAKQSVNQEWILHQTSPNTGKNVIYVSRDAVKIASPFGFELISRAPDWKVHAVSPQKKLEWVEDMSRYDGRMMLRPLNVGSLNKSQMEDRGLESKNGIRCRKFVTSPEEIEQIWSAQDIAIAPKGAEFLQRFYCSPPAHGVPIHRKKFFPGRRKPKATAWIVDYTHPLNPSWKTNLDTLSCKQVPFNPQDFKIAPGYKRTSIITDITYSRQKMSDLTDALDNIGFRVEPKK